MSQVQLLLREVVCTDTFARTEKKPSNTLTVSGSQHPQPWPGAFLGIQSFNEGVWVEHVLNMHTGCP